MLASDGRVLRDPGRGFFKFFFRLSLYHRESKLTFARNHSFLHREGAREWEGEGVCWGRVERLKKPAPARVA